MNLPHKLANSFAQAINDKEILILGGLKFNQNRSSSHSKKFEIESKVMVLNVDQLSNNSKKNVHKMVKYLKPLPFKKKLSQVRYNGEGKLFCFVMDKNDQLP